MKISEVLSFKDGVSNFLDLNKIFDIEHAEFQRIYLDGIIHENPIAEFNLRLNHAYSVIVPLLSDSINYFFLIRRKNFEIESVLSELRKSLEELSIESDNNLLQFLKSEYNEDEELYYYYYKIELNKMFLIPFIWSSISSGYRTIYPSGIFDVFIYDTQNKILVNIYDDRGMVILNLV